MQISDIRYHTDYQLLLKECADLRPTLLDNNNKTVIFASIIKKTTLQQ